MTPSAKSVPGYLTEDFITSALNDGFKRSDVKIHNMSAGLISEGGENYCSDIYQVKVEYSTGAEKNQDISLIVKDMKKDYMLGLPEMECKEIIMYNQVVPKLEEILGTDGELAPKCFKATREHDEVFIFQDMSVLGYGVANRLTGLDEGHAHALLKKIAIFHASSMVLGKTHPELIKHVGKSFYENGIGDIDIMVKMLYGCFDTVKEVAKGWDSFEEVTTKLNNLRSKYDKKLIEAQDSNKTRFKVLNHGDLWINNFLIKDDDKQNCVDIKLIDLQLTTWASPGYDLHYFFTTSIPLDIAVTKRYELLRTYYKSLRDTLTRAKYSNIPTWDDLLNEMRVTEFFSVHVVLLAMPLMCLEKEASKGNDMNTLKDEEVMKQKRVAMYKSKRLLETTKYILDRANDSGILD